MKGALLGIAALAGVTPIAIYANLYLAKKSGVTPDRVIAAGTLSIALELVLLVLAIVYY